MKILVIGKNGQVGWELQRTLAPLGNVVALGRTELDLADATSIRCAVRERVPQVVVNAAAYTAVDKAEMERDLAMAINGIAPGILAEETARLGALLVHYSTDYVFDGLKTGAYSEDDPPNPVNIYGETKLAGERAIHATASRYIILRTSWVYALRGRNFLLTILRLAAEQDQIRVVDDQTGAPTWSRSVAESSLQIIRRRLDVRGTSEEGLCNGVFHMTAAGSTSWYGFAREIIAQTQDRRERNPVLIPIASSEYPTVAKRPSYTVLSNDKLRRVFGFELNSWDCELRRALGQNFS